MSAKPKRNPWTKADGEIHGAGLKLGYARISTLDQNLALQQDALKEAGCGHIYIEQMSGAVEDRPAFCEALSYSRSGNILIVWKLDRLARSMKQLIETVEKLRSRGIGFHSLTEAIDTTTAQGVLVFHSSAPWRSSNGRSFENAPELDSKPRSAWDERAADRGS